MSTTIGNVDSDRRGEVDERGRVALDTGVSIDWAVRSTEQWLDPVAGAFEQRRIDGAPVVETAVRVPGGHAVHRAWCAVQRTAEWAVVEVENRSKAPLAVAFSVDGAKRSTLRLPRTPSRAAGTLAELVADGGTTSPTGEEPAVVFPLAHTATVRVALPMAKRQRDDVDLAALPDAERVARGWGKHAEPPGSIRLVLPDERLASELLAARADLVLLDHLGRRSRARQRLRRVDEAVAFLGRWLEQLVRVEGGRLVLATPWPESWLGQGVEVHDARTSLGRVSYAVRWHGARPALLWDVEASGPVTIAAPGLDAGWTSNEARGEALLATVGAPKVVAPLAAGQGGAPDEGSFT